jgi:hypothetical protein
MAPRSSPGPFAPATSGAAATSGYQVGQLTFHSGAVMHGATLYSVFWEPPGWTVSPAYAQVIDQFLTDVGASRPMGISAQYTDAAGAPGTVQFGGSWIDTAPFPGGEGGASKPLSDGDVQVAAESAFAVNSAWSKTSNSEVFVFLPDGAYESLGTNETSFTNFCAYHSAVQQGSVSLAYASMPYAATALGACSVYSPGATTPNGDLDADAEISALSHELFESLTDVYSFSAGRWGGWYYQDTQHEIGDECNFRTGPLDASGGNVVAHGHEYAVQEEWSNWDGAADGVTQAGGCVLFARTPTALSASPAMSLSSRNASWQLRSVLTVAKTGTPLAGRTVVFSAGSTVLCRSVTDQTGTARCDGRSSMGPILLNHGYGVAYAGDATTYYPSSAKGALTG